jgi:hypothetical protein
MRAESLQEAGPLLEGLLEAQRLEEEVVGYSQITAVADAVIQRATELRNCLVWPVGAAAERVAGVVTARAREAVDVGSWNTPVEDRQVLLVAVAAVSPISLEAAADQLRLRGAAEVHACGVYVRGGARAIGLDSYKQLCSSSPRSPFALVGDAA